MLKIAEYNTITGKKVDLKELEKYGIVRNQYGELAKIIYEGRRGQAFEIVINEYNRMIEGYSYGADGDGEEQPIDDTLYDLIKDGLVIKED